jgi:hypothetical protein
MSYEVKEIKGFNSKSLELKLNEWSFIGYKIVSIQYIEKYFKWIVVIKK